jgi:hypothetical protein
LQRQGKADIAEPDNSGFHVGELNGGGSHLTSIRPAAQVIKEN